jgi:hypothetical protein
MFLLFVSWMDFIEKFLCREFDTSIELLGCEIFDSDGRERIVFFLMRVLGDANASLDEWREHNHGFRCALAGAGFRVLGASTDVQSRLRRLV